MKKILTLLLVGLLVFSLAACGEDTNDPSGSDKPGVSQSGFGGCSIWRRNAGRNDGEVAAY